MRPALKEAVKKGILTTISVAMADALRKAFLLLSRRSNQSFGCFCNHHGFHRFRIISFAEVMILTGPRRQGTARKV